MIKWSAEQRQSSTATPTVPAVRFHATLRPEWVATASDVVAAINKPGVKIVDARTAAEINGQNMGNVRRGGFVPSSIPVYWEDLLDAKEKTFKSADELKAISAVTTEPGKSGGIETICRLRRGEACHYSCSIVYPLALSICSNPSVPTR